MLYRYHVQGEVTLPDPGYPPYYDKTFFDTIKHYKDNSPLNITVMTTKQWYQALMEDQVLMSPANDDSPATLLPVRVELLHPSTDWTSTWSLSRTKGLSSDLTAFLFRLLHQLLPTQDRVSRLVGGQNEHTGRCSLCLQEVEDQVHAFFTCQKSMIPGLACIGYVQTVLPNLSQDEALRLEFGQELSEADCLATVCILSTGLKYIWEARVEKKAATVYKMRAEIEAKVSIVRKTRYSNSGTKIMEMMN